MTQLEKILEMIGRPSDAALQAVNSPFAAAIMEQIPPQGPNCSWDSYWQASGATPDAVSLLARLLVFDPRKRFSAQDALQCQYVGAFHDPRSEINAVFKVNSRLHLDDNQKRSTSVYRDQLYQLISSNSKSHGDRRAGDASTRRNMLSHR